MSGLFWIATAILSLSYSNAMAGNPTQYEVNVRLPNGSYQRMIVSADTPANAKAMTEAQYCAEKKDCIASGPHLAH